MLHSHPEASIVVLGDAMLDIYINGDVERISREAPVPIVRRRYDKQVVGGAGNVACNIARLGGASTLITTVGDDLEGAGLVTLLKAEGVSVDVVVTPGRGTISKTRVMAGSHHLLRIDREDTSPIPTAIEDAVLARLEDALSRARALAISDYAKGMLTDRVLATAIALARAQRVPVIVDPKRREFSAYAGADVIKPNRLEVSAASGLSCQSDEELNRAAEQLIRLTDSALLVTRSEKGMSYFSPGAVPIHMPTHAKLVFDVSGAGDTVLATLACGLVGNLPIEQTMRLANLAAGIVVSKRASLSPSLAWRRSRSTNCGRRPRSMMLPRRFAREAWRPSAKLARFVSFGAGRGFRSVSPTVALTYCTLDISRSCAARRGIAIVSSSVSTPTRRSPGSRGRPGPCSARRRARWSSARSTASILSSSSRRIPLTI
jgi:D-beta-D-heptose 7-phosphate kinase/D-beta-D-heptose 1-phosphate adenosyltransferase